MITDKLKPIGTTGSKETVRVAGIVKSVSTPGGGGGETDPTVPAHVKAITTEDIDAWNAASVTAYAPVVYTQSSPALVWIAPNPFGRVCGVELVDSAGNEFEADVTHDAPAYTTITITLKSAVSGRALIT